MTLEFPGNKLLAALGGAHEKHFARLEQALGVHITSRGNLVAVEGARTRTCGRDPESALCKIGSRRKHYPGGSRCRDPLYRWRARRPARRHPHRRRAGHPAAHPAQADYLDLMRTNPLVFGIGPAGTGKTYLARPPSPPICCRSGGWSGSFSPAPRSKPASGWAFLPGDLNEKIDPYLRPLLGCAVRCAGRQGRRGCASRA